MAQFQFLGTWDDSWGILDAILEHPEYSLVPDLYYDKPEPLFVTKIGDAAKRMLLDRRNGFIWSTKFSLYSPNLKQVKEGQNAGKYYVDPTGQGPVLRLVLPACYEEGGVINLAPAMFSCPRWTVKPGTYDAMKASPELREGYKEVKAVIRKQLVRLKVRPDIWSGREASRLVDQNQARIHGFERPGMGRGGDVVD